MHYRKIQHIYIYIYNKNRKNVRGWTDRQTVSESSEYPNIIHKLLEILNTANLVRNTEQRERACIFIYDHHYKYCMNPLVIRFYESCAIISTSHIQCKFNALTLTLPQIIRDIAVPFLYFACNKYR